METAAVTADEMAEHGEEQTATVMDEPHKEKQWVKQWDDATSSFFYLDAATGECSWQTPSDYCDEGDSNHTDTNEDQVDQPTVNTDVQSNVEGHCSWIAQYDPTTKRVYFYNTHTGDCQWDEPADFVGGEHQDEKMDGAVKIQSVFRSKKARDRVKKMAQGVDSRSVTVSRPQSATTTETADGSVSNRLWRQHYDPRSQQYYYYNIETGETAWEKPTGDGEILTNSDPQGDSVVKIQCAFRKRAASKCVETKKQVVRDLTSAEVITQKLKDLMRAVDEIQDEVEARARTLSTTTRPVHLDQSLASWKSTVAQIRDRVLDHHHHARLVQQLEATEADRLTAAHQFHDALAATRTECLAVLKSILLTDASFVDVEATRVNAAFQRYVRAKSDALFAIPEAKIRKLIRVDEIEEALAQAEKSLRKAMGMTGFNAGATTTTTTSLNKIYGEWRDDVEEASESVSRLEKIMSHKRDLLAMYQHSLTESNEINAMQQEEELSWVCERAVRDQELARLAHIRFLEKCRQSWEKGLHRRQDDDRAQDEADGALEAKRQKERERMENMKVVEQERQKRVSLSIWEAVKEGHTVETIRGMVFAEMQKARRNGFDFVIRTARSDRGESLVQIACWNGHTELVEFLLDESADLHVVDSLYNRYTLLHDASRRGYSQIIRLLVDRGLPQDVVDRAGDTPLHWAVRKNHYEAVHTLLGAYMPRHDPDHNDCALRAVRAKNHRGRTPIQLAKSESMRRLLQAFDEGRIRIPQFHTRPTSGTSTSPQQTQTRRKSSFGVSRAGSFRSTTSAGDNTGNQQPPHQAMSPLAKGSSSDTMHHPHAQQPNGLGEDEFGAIHVWTAR